MQRVKTNKRAILYRFLLLLGCALLVTALSNAQTFYPKHFRFDSYSINNGLSESKVPAIAEDKYGEIVMATQKGMDIFNGYTFQHIANINHSKSDTMQPEKLGMIEKIRKWQNGYFFIRRYDSATFLFNPSDRSFIPTDSLLRFSDKKNDWGFRRINDILTTSGGRSWIATDNGILILDPNDGSGIPSIKRIFNGPALKVTTLQRDDKKRIWALSEQNDILIIDPVTHQQLYKIRPTDLHPKNRSTNPFIIYADPSGHIYIATSSRIFHFTGIKKNAPSFEQVVLNDQAHTFDHVRINCLLRDASGMLWIGTTNNGILLYNTDKQRVTGHLIQTPFYPASINSNQINCLIEDSHHRIWIGTSNGVNKFDPSSQRFALYSQDPVNPQEKLSLVFSIIGVDAQHIIAVSQGRAVYINTETHEMETIELAKELGKSILTHCLAPGRSGNIWCATSSGLKVIKKHGARYLIEDIEAPELMPLRHQPLYEILSIGDSLLWLSQNNNEGLFLWNRQAHSLTQFTHDDANPHSIYNSRVSFLMADQSGDTWFGTDDGISRYNAATGQFDNFLNRADDGPNQVNHVMCMAEDGKYLWVSTFDNGLIKFDREKNTYIRYTTADGLPDNNIYAVIIDNNGHPWISSDKGLSQFFEEKRHFRNFTKEDGLQSNEFDANSVYKNPSGELFFGGVNGINKIDPERIYLDTAPVPIMISNISIVSPDGQYELFPGDNQQIHLSYQENTLLIQFAALNFATPESNYYRYKLITDNIKESSKPGNKNLWNFLTFRGFMNNTWIDAGDKNTVVYSHVPPGKYKFQLSAKNSDGLWNESPLSLSIVIKPPFWQTTWFKTFIIIVILLLIYAIFRWRLKAVKRIHRQKLEKAEMNQKIHDLERMALRAQMNPHFIFNSLNSIKAYVLDSNPEEAVEYLNDFSSLIRKVLQNSRKEKIYLSEELEAIKKYVKLEERRLKKNVNLIIKSDKTNALSRFLIPPLIIQPFIENAIWHGIRPLPLKEAGHIELCIQEVEHSLQVSITDNGIGRAQASSYRTGSHKVQSMGVSITQARLAHLGGKRIKNIRYEDVPGKQGTKVTLWIHKEDL